MMSPTHVRCLVSKTPPLLAQELTQRYFLCHRLTVWRMTNARTRSSHTVLICSALPAPRNGQAMRILPFATSILTKRKGSKMRGPPVRRQPPQHGGGLGLSVGPEHQGAALYPHPTPGMGGWAIVFWWGLSLSKAFSIYRIQHRLCPRLDPVSSHWPMLQTVQAGTVLDRGRGHLQPAQGQWTPGLGSWSGDQRLPPHTVQWWICVDRCSCWQWGGVAVVWWDTVGIHQLGWRATNRRKPRFSAFDKVY